jgi:hypothetical protein
MVVQRRRKRKDREKKTFYNTPSLINLSPSNGPKQFDSSIHPLMRVSRQTDVCRRALRIHGLRSTIGATVQKVTFSQLQSPCSNLFFWCYRFFILCYTTIVFIFFSQSTNNIFFFSTTILQIINCIKNCK